MGSYYTYGATRRDIIEDLCKTFKVSENREHRTLKHCCVGNVLYSLNEYDTGVDSARVDGVVRYIGVNLLLRSPEGWGYKPMDETMHPYYYDCPLSYLDEASAPENASAAEWREKVRALAAEKKETRRIKASLKAGVTQVAWQPGRARP